MNSISKTELAGTLSWYYAALELIDTEYFDQPDTVSGEHLYEDTVLLSCVSPMYLEILGGLLDSGSHQIKGFDVSKQVGQIVLHTGEYQYSDLDFQAILELGAGAITKEVAADGKTLTLSLLTYEDFYAASDYETEEAPVVYYTALHNLAYVVWRIARQINYSHHQSHLYEYIDDLERMVDDFRKAISRGVSGDLDLLDYLQDTTDWYVGMKSHRKRVEMADTYFSELEGTFEDED